jgi:uncharacterized DUF497 family protein
LRNLRPSRIWIQWARRATSYGTPETPKLISVSTEYDSATLFGYSWIQATSTSTPPHAEDGEKRRKAAGMIDGKLFVIVYHARGDALRITSARRANAQEVRQYERG